MPPSAARNQMFNIGVHHVSINVDDVERNRRFYVDVLGFEPLERPDLGIDGAWLQMGPQELHLIELPLMEGFGPHFALEVADIGAAIEALRSKGVEVSEVNRMDGVCLQAFLNDPAGNQIELNERV